jgi:exopolyphosphatase/guanosine-5'-triphosphate,3'-diphosphate pyrophosphatase
LGAGIDHAGEGVVVCDIGGGSTEISVGSAGEAPVYSRSFNVGCRRVTERFFDDDPPAEVQINTAKTWTLEQFSEVGDFFRTHIGTPASTTPCQGPKIVAVAGTATSAVTMRDKITTYDSSLVNGARVSSQDLAGLLDMLKSCTTSERAKIPGLDPGRAPVIVAGMIILQCVLETFNANEFFASDNDILEGAILTAARNEL